MLNYNIKTIIAMFSEDKVTEIFYLADEFCKFFNARQEKSLLEAPKDGKKHRRKPNRMSDAEIIVILIVNDRDVPIEKVVSRAFGRSRAPLPARPAPAPYPARAHRHL